MKNTAAKIIEAAEKKFGEVIGIAHHPLKGYSLAILRDDAPTPRKYMTITAGYHRDINNNISDVDFYWGHYEIETAHAAILDMANRAA